MADLHSTIETLEHRLMRAWIGGDARTLKALTSRKFRLVMGSKPCAILDAPSWLDAATSRYVCESYRFGDIYARDIGPMAIFASQLTMKATMDGHDWSGEFWVTDLWQKSRVRRNWKLVERILSRPDDNPDVHAAIRTLQRWRK